jgi:hypothetical protein
VERCAGCGFLGIVGQFDRRHGDEDLVSGHVMTVIVDARVVVESGRSMTAREMGAGFARSRRGSEAR